MQPSGIAGGARFRPGPVFLRAQGLLGRAASVVAEAVRAAFVAEADRWVLWAPVLFGLGVALFFALPRPPPAPAAVLAAVLAAAAACWIAARRGPKGAAPLAAAAALAALGFGAAQLRVVTVEGRLLDRPITAKIEGRIVELAPTEKGAKLLLEDVRVDRKGTQPPARVRVSVRDATGLAVGDRVGALARLQAPSPPLLPGAFDFARHAWFQGIGAVGFALGAVERLQPAEGRGLSGFAQGLRERITRRFVEASPDSAGHMSAAMMTGLQAGISDEVWRDMQRSGLAHLISISGLHMTMVAGTLFLVLRYLLALVPALALRWPVKKLAAAGGILGVTFYLLISGMSVPTQRAWLMCVLGFAAVLADRNPFSPRILAVAAMAVLAWRPDSLLGPSFQLSFAAMLALIAFFEAWPRRGAEDGAEPPPSWSGPLRYVGGVVGTTVVASLATAPLTAWHFQSVSTYSVLANALAVPLTSFVVMPAGMLALALMPFGLDGPAIATTVLGVDGVLAVAAFVADLPGAAWPIAQLPPSCLLLFVAGGLWLGLWRGRLRVLGIPLLAAAGAVAAVARPYDVLVHPTFDMVSVRGEGGSVRLLERDRDGFVREAWLRGLGVAAAEPFPKPLEGPADGLACDASGCVLSRAGRRVALAFRVDAALADCRNPAVDLVIAAAGPERCAGGPARLVGPRALRRSDGLALRVSADGWEIVTVAERRGAWPWTWEGSRAAAR